MTTRDKDYAFDWASVTLLFDWEKLKRDFKIKTISWNYRGAFSKNNFDKEREEFVISDFMTQTLNDIENEFFQITEQIYNEQGLEAEKLWRKENGDDYIEYWQRKGSKNIDFSKYLLGVFICKDSYDIYKGKGFEMALNHPLFKGFVSGKESKLRHKNSMKKI